MGTSIALAALNRVCDPCSKLAFSHWWAETAGDRWPRVPAAALDHRRFRDAMDAIWQVQIEEIRRRLVARMLETFGVGRSGLVLDMTNFATWTDSGNDRAPIAQRGHSKQKRNDLRLVGLGLVSVDGGVPLLSHAYAGNLPDVTQFPVMVEELAARFEGLCAEHTGSEEATLTLVFDAGQNSEDNFALLDSLPLHFVGSVAPSDHPDLLAVPIEKYRAVDPEHFPGLVARETKKVIFGKQRRVVLCHSDGLHDRPSRGLDQTLAKVRRQLFEIAARLARGKTRKSGERAGRAGSSRPDKAKTREELEAELFGKRILVTDKDSGHASTARIVADYRSQEAAEGDFRQMKDPKVVSFSPMFHFTDSKIRVHVFSCVVPLMAPGS